MPYRFVVELGGSWRATEADEAVRRSSVTSEADDHGWTTVVVPGHWASTPGLAGATGPVLHRKRFTAGRPAGGERAWLVFDALCHQGDVWLDGAYLGDTDGWFNRHTFEVTDGLRASGEHVLAVEVSAGPSPMLGSLGPLVPEHGSPGGIWGDVRLERTGPVRARDLRVLCREATDELAVVVLRAELDSDAARTVTLTTSVSGVHQVDERPVAAGSNFVEWTVGIDDPVRWWPHALGDQPLHELTVEVAADGAPSHTLTRRIGLRAVARNDRVLRVNGEHLFLKGLELEPPSSRLGDVPPEWWRTQVDDAKAAGFDLLRVKGFVAPVQLYAAADEAGLLLWQDLPLVGKVDRRTRRQAARLATTMVDLLGHHPSIALWCGHDEPEGGPLSDRSISRALADADPTRPVVPRASIPGWQAHGRDLATVGRMVPRLVRFLILPPDRLQVEALRRLKYRPAGGFCLSPGEADGGDARAACRPVAVVADPLPAVVRPGDTLALDIHVVNDLRHRLDGTVRCRLAWGGGERSWEWAGTVDADAVARVATVPVVVPTAPGELVLELELDHAGSVVTNQYASRIG